MVVEELSWGSKVKEIVAIEKNFKTISFVIMLVYIYIVIIVLLV